MGECFTGHSGTDNNVPYINHIIILNLAIADLLMGIYLMGINIFNVIYSGRYCTKSIEWLSGYYCRILGVLVVVSSQTSVFMLTFLSTIRLITTIKVSSTLLYKYLLQIVNFTI